jgi:hypothetical protein
MAQTKERLAGCLITEQPWSAYRAGLLIGSKPSLMRNNQKKHWARRNSGYNPHSKFYESNGPDVKILFDFLRFALSEFASIHACGISRIVREFDIGIIGFFIGGRGISRRLVFADRAFINPDRGPNQACAKADPRRHSEKYSL